MPLLEDSEPAGIPVSACRFSPDKYLAQPVWMAHPGWDVARGRVAGIYQPKRALYGVAFTPDGKM
jgi:hypothetical protein